jgi:hypothetical protein
VYVVGVTSVKVSVPLNAGQLPAAGAEYESVMVVPPAVKVPVDVCVLEAQEGSTSVYCIVILLPLILPVKFDDPLLPKVSLKPQVPDKLVPDSVIITVK